SPCRRGARRAPRRTPPRRRGRRRDSRPRCGGAFSWRQPCGQGRSMSVLPWSRPAEKALYTLAGRFYGAPPRKEFSRMDPFKSRVTPAEGKLAVLLPGMGAVATTFIAGVEAV